MKVDEVFHIAKKEASHITLSLDGWSNCRMQSLYAFVAILPGRTLHLLGIDDLSSVSHTAEFLASKLKAHVDAAVLCCRPTAAGLLSLNQIF